MAEKSYQEKLQAKIQALTITEQAKSLLNKDESYRRVLRANKIEAARDGLAVSLAIAKERAEMSLAQRLANADAILALSEADKSKLMRAQTALNPPKSTKTKSTKTKGANGANGKGAKSNGANGSNTKQNQTLMS
jgi:hypothetical protein